MPTTEPPYHCVTVIPPGRPPPQKPGAAVPYIRARGAAGCAAYLGSLVITASTWPTSPARHGGAAGRQAAARRLVGKDARDIYRLLAAVPTGRLAASLRRLRQGELAVPATEQALSFLTGLFAAGLDAPGSVMAGRVEEGIGQPQTVSAAFLASDLLAAISGAPA